MSPETQIPFRQLDVYRAKFGRSESNGMAVGPIFAPSMSLRLGAGR